MNYLRPGLKHCAFSAEEEETVVSLHSKLGNQWSRIAQHLPGRTDNEVKNYWNTYLRKKQFLRTGGAKRQDDAPPPRNGQGSVIVNHQAEPEEHGRKIMFVDCLDSAGASLMMAPAATPRAGGASDVGDLQPDLMMSRHHDQGPPVQVGGAVGSLRGSGLAGDGGGTCWDWEPDGMVDHMYMSVQGGGLWDLPSFSEFLESNYGEA
ncbi:hypothetical protein U9M48_004581 [Paspalum notatum var. saurae]|uniref:Uncharacterized protein n=1 Tax=Paspalum notatum var. saurae TaxID=547442 RepID=A0AAQ3PV19_PASNO